MKVLLELFPNRTGRLRAALGGYFLTYQKFEEDEDATLGSRV
jgi:hypothetical protein